jgi:hypothetical protein
MLIAFHSDHLHRSRPSGVKACVAIILLSNEKKNFSLEACMGKARLTVLKQQNFTCVGCKITLIGFFITKFKIIVSPTVELKFNDFGSEMTTIL